MSQFVHLHLHTDYSMLDGACDVEKLVQCVKELGMPAVAMTDHGNIFGAVNFVNAAHKVGVKPIVGCELYICKKQDHNIERTPPDGDTYNHLLVLAENEEDDSVVLAETEDEVQQPAAAKAASVGASQPAKRGVAQRWP